MRGGRAGRRAASRSRSGSRVGALTYFVAAGRVAAMGGGAALALGAFLDGIPEQMVLGIGLAPVRR